MQLSGSSRTKASDTITWERVQDEFPHYCNVVHWKQDTFHVSRCKAQRVVEKKQHTIQSRVLFCHWLFLWRFSCPLSTSVCLSLKWRDHWRPLWKGLRIETMVQENKIGYQREWTDDAARWICSLYSRSWEQLLLSLKVIAHIPTGMWWWWHIENLLSLSRAGPTLF